MSLASFLQLTLTFFFLNKIQRHAFLALILFFSSLDSFFYASFIFMTGWIALKYNKPLMTRTDIRTGKNVSLLMFIHSKYRM